MCSKLEKRNEFIKKANENNTNNNFHLSIFKDFKKDLEIDNLNKLYKQDFLESKMLLIMIEYAEEYHKQKMLLLPEPLLTDLETTIKGLENLHGSIKKIYKPLDSVISLKMGDGASYKVSINRNIGEVTLD